MMRSFLSLPAKGRYVDVSVVPAWVEFSMVEPLGERLKVAWFEVVENLEGRLKSNAFFFSRKSPKFLENTCLASALSLRTLYLGDTLSIKFEFCLLVDAFLFSKTHSNSFSKWFFRFD